MRSSKRDQRLHRLLSWAKGLENLEPTLNDARLLEQRFRLFSSVEKTNRSIILSFYGAISLRKPDAYAIMASVEDSAFKRRSIAWLLDHQQDRSLAIETLCSLGCILVANRAAQQLGFLVETPFIDSIERSFWAAWKILNQIDAQHGRTGIYAVA